MEHVTQRAHADVVLEIEEADVGGFHDADADFAVFFLGLAELHWRPPTRSWHGQFIRDGSGCRGEVVAKPTGRRPRAWKGGSSSLHARVISARRRRGGA